MALSTIPRATAAVAEVATLALRGATWSDTIKLAVERLSEVNGGAPAAVLACDASRDGLTFAAAAGWPNAVEGTRGPLTPSSPFAKAIREDAGLLRLGPGDGLPSDLEMFTGAKLAAAALLRFGQGAEADGIVAVFFASREALDAFDDGFCRAMTAVVEAAWVQSRTALESREAERRLRLAQTAGRMGTWAWDVRAGTVEWSESLQMVHGLTPGSFEGTFAAFVRDIHPEDLERVLGEIEHSLVSGTHEIEYRIVIPGGRIVWVSARGQVLYDAEGRPSRVVGMCMDVTQRRRAEDALQLLGDVASELAASLDYDETLERLAAIIVPRFADWCAIDILQTDGDLEVVDRVAVVHRDPSRREAIATISAARVDPGEPELDGARRAIATGQGILFSEITPEMVAKSKAPKEYLSAMETLGSRSAMVVPLRARGATFGAITFVCGDSGRKYDEEDLAVAQHVCRRASLSLDNSRLYREARQIEAELRRANEAKDEFLGLMSHELRTPITVIYGGAKLLRSRATTVTAEEREQVLGDIEGEADRLFRMVENLLALSRAELQDVELEPVLVQRVVGRFAAVFGERDAERMARLRVSAPDDLPPVAAHAGYIEHIVRNLVSNAVKYSPPGSPIEISATTVPGAGRVSVTVADRGTGVAPDEVDKIFQRFYRSDQTSQMASGAGMGLAVCTRLLAAMDGEISARARDGGGLEVTFTLPINQEALD
ncbi:MAG TPA: ATP-binding protein [Tepidiformaceae bacterium]|nr:ATP-binding protein [Tepidiformaceae bacterium]